MGQDRDTLRETGEDDSVEVNQRALIDKVLARYSGEFTVFRELLQNSDDAHSSVVEIRFETAAYLSRVRHTKEGNIKLPLPDLKTTHVSQWTFKNNGFAFTDKDWARLRKIADGNPDQEKIGAFGVGFYSLFSATDNPLVSSGGYGMEFYWKHNKDQLSIRRGKLSSKGTTDPWTKFEIGLRKAGPIPPVFDLLRFLASSITFMVYLNELSVYFDEHRIGHIKKSYGNPTAIEFPIALKPSSESNIMNVKAVQSRTITIEAEVMHAVYATAKSLSPEESEPCTPNSPKGSTKLHKTSVTLTAFTAEASAQVNEELSSEFLRSTKKKPPPQLKYHLIYTGKEDYKQSIADDENQPSACGSIFRGLRADLSGATHTRVFIGHATGQTTGIGGHMASYFIPTVERESIDFVDKHLAVWNQELLYVGGLLARVAYESQLSAMHSAWIKETNSALDSRSPQELQHRLQEEFIHTLKFFEFHRSTPSPTVGQMLEAAFYGCASASPRMLSSVGVCDASAIKEHDPILAKFLKNMPMLPQSIAHGCAHVIQTLKNKKIISPVTFSDVLGYLRQRPLNKEELVSCLQWWIRAPEQDRSNTHMAQLLDAVILRDMKGGALRLSSVRYFADPQTLGSHIPAGSPLPLSFLPHDIAKHFLHAQLIGFGWQEFTIVDWLQYISREEIMYRDYDFTRSPDWTVRVLTALARLWPSASNDAHNATREMFSTRRCIPTSHGPCAPEESYLPGTSTGLFRDLQLPMVQLPDGMKITDEIEAVFLFIGVRKHVNPQFILKQMAETKKWNVTGLVGYLCEVRKSLTREELAELASSAIFAQEGDSDPTKRYCACKLYAPTGTFRRLRLPVIRWEEKSKWSDGSDEAKLLFQLGLRHCPPLEEIVRLCSSKDDAIRIVAFEYLCENLASKYHSYDPRSVEHVAFIPAENNHGNHLGRPGDVFLDRKWKALGFSVVHDDYVDAPISELGALEHPPPSKLIAHLTKVPPQGEAAAQLCFEILSDHISAFESHELINLSKVQMVPTHSSGIRNWSTPAQCYLGEGKRDAFQSKLFAFVDFGPTANRFLSACGARNEPTVADVAQSLVDDPKRFYEVASAEGPENALTQLRNLAVNKHRIPNLTLGKMKFGPILLGKKTMGAIQAWNHYAHEQRGPKDIVIADDINAYRLFREDILVAPQEELLEDFYASLGSKRLSDIVQEKCQVVGDVSDQDTLKRCSEIRMLVLERLALFLHEFTYAKPKVPSDWLCQVGNFKVKACDSLSIHKTLDIGGKKIERVQEASAGAKKDNQGRIELWLSKNALSDPDMYEVSTSLCRLLFGTAKISESLLFSMILSTDLDALRRRGCHVDLILNRCHFERDVPMADDGTQCGDKGQEVPRATSSPELDPSSPENQGGNTVSEVPIPSTSAPPTRQNPPPLIEPSRSHVAEAEMSIPSASPKPQQPVGRTSAMEASTSSTTGERRHVAQVSSDHASLLEGSDTLHRTPSSTAHVTRGPKSQSHRWKVRNFFRQEVRTGQHATPRPEIRETVNRAIKACNPEEAQLRCELSAIEAKKCSNDHYCHDKTAKLKPVGEFPVGAFQSPRMGNSGTVQVFAAEDLPFHKAFISTKKKALKHFAKIVVPVAEAYNLSTKSLNIFYDEEGSCIAFNRNGSLYLNLRYFEAWHDEDVAKGFVRQAQTSWFFTLAHEIAHNMVKSHNSDHAFWFSNICEEHISNLERILGSKVA